MTGTLFAVVSFIALITFGMVFYSRRHAEAFRALLSEYADESGLTYSAAKLFKHPVASGEVDGRELIIDAFIRDPGNTNQIFSRVRLSGDDLPMLQLDAEGKGIGSLWKMVTGVDEVLGDELFDDQVLVRGHEAEVTALLNEATREVVFDMITQKVTFKNGELYFEQRGYFKSVSEIQDVVRLMERAAGHLRVTDTPADQQLAQNAIGDSDPEVRARNIAMLWLHHPHSRALLDALEATLPDNKLGEPLSTAEEHDLLSFLDAASERIGLDKQLTAAVSLGLWGTVESIPRLREWANEPHGDLDFVKRAALEAVAAIQARVGEIEAGVLSMAQTHIGSLAIPDREAGALAITKTETSRKRAMATNAKQKN